MAARSRHSAGWLMLTGALVVVAAIALWLLFAGRAATPTAPANLDLRRSMPEAPILPPVEPPTLPAPGPSPAPVG